MQKANMNFSAFYKKQLMRINAFSIKQCKNLPTIKITDS